MVIAVIISLISFFSPPAAKNYSTSSLLLGLLTHFVCVRMHTVVVIVIYMCVCAYVYVCMDVFLHVFGEKLEISSTFTHMYRLCGCGCVWLSQGA